ncbi:MAG TPA: TetR/AcrR family transcriptional regulator [Gemmatimonadaceae bacterium]|nr:TetR/AcrR family transcriptional regulator [Gemmatimonadaceae bacterium]
MAQDRLPRDPDATRQRILHAAFAEFYRNGYQGGSLNRIVQEAGGTKGALFHHFAGKEPLGHAVVDEIIGPLLVQRWLAPLDGADDPISAIQQAFRRFIGEDIASGHFTLGCPLNNLAQEMSPLDDAFRTRIEGLYRRWREAVAAALAAGMERGTVRPNVAPDEVAALVVAAQMGIWGTGKQSQDAALMGQAGEAVCHWLESLRA